MYLVKYMKRRHIHLSSLQWKCYTSHGVNVRLRYVLKLTISRNYVSNIVEHRLSVRNYTPLPTINNSIKMEVGIEDCLHIEFEYSKSKYHLKDVIIGKIYFLLVRIKIKIWSLRLDVESLQDQGLTHTLRQRLSQNMN
ncbi:vacuolar protein sorting-associated protein 26B-like [Iris pallida]|uniref:Vacuolar protein sorting-associated protein 26B-like n=1 Tax=Iris pallida TaxID=29817 RepID=A0AAX6DIW4_IRIPA|nr:vacuolar protein sorting-associated protein 26B-like [Iris pallida]